jgi:multidrug resistance protein, MATE family
LNKEILKLAFPNIISNISVPLLGLVDIAVLGHLPDIVYLNSVAVGSLVFNFIYWNFSFLRMGASGLSAQAYGQGNIIEQRNILIRGIAIACAAGLLLVIIKKPLGDFALYAIGASKEVTAEASKYFYIRMYEAPAAIGLFAISGWFIGMHKPSYAMAAALATNLVNVALNYWLAIILGMYAEGVALGTVISQYTGLAIAAAIAYKKFPALKDTAARAVKEAMKGKEMRRFFTVNRDIFLRTLCVIFVMSFFTSRSAIYSDTVLAANTILMKYFLFYSFFIDGFAYAAESITGRLAGAGRRRELLRYSKGIFAWGASVSICIAACFAAAGDNIMSILTSSQEVISTGAQYMPWIWAVPIIGAAGFLWDGIYIGATAARTMRNSLFTAAAVFFASYFPLSVLMGNHGLWLAFLLFLAARGLFQTLAFKKYVLLKRGL